MRIGSLFTGVGGLDLAVRQVFGGEHAWFSEIDPAASKVLAYRFPGVPNLGDITQIDWTAVEPVDVLCGGFPCQDVSAAGKRAGIKAGTRSGLWAVFADAIDALRPRWVVIENVRGLLSAQAHREVDDGADQLEPAAAVVGDGAGRPVLRAAGAVLGDMADLGYDAQWTTVAAADVGAPHRRERVFIVAHAGGAAVGEPAGSASAEETRPGSGDRSGDSRGERTIADGRQTCGCGDRRIDHDWFANTDRFDDGGCRRCRCENFWPAADSSGDGWDEGRPESARLAGGFDAAVSGDEPGVALLPTPSACNANDGEGTETWLARREAVKARVKNGNGMGMPLSIAVQLLPTPNASDASGGGQHPDKRGGHSRQLIDYVLLCTPSASDGAGGKTSRSGSRIDEPLLGGQAREMETAWGKYEPAIRRWEQVTGTPAPAPTEPNKNGNPRLSAAFSEWLMGWPPGWVTDPAIGISRNDQLRCVGNGVVSRCAEAAIRYLLKVAA